MNFLLCQSCGQHYWMTESHCPHCHTSSKTRWVRGSTNAAVTLLLGLGLVGCQDDSADKDTADTYDTMEPSNELEPSNEADYGVPDTGEPDTGDTGDTGNTQETGETGSPIEPSNEADYGVPDIDFDGDGFYEFEDCDDNDPNTFPGSSPNDSDTACMKDVDGDDYGDRAPVNPAVTPGSDCDDDNPTTYPGQGC